jgi:phosphohistidine phosphatase
MRLYLVQHGDALSKDADPERPLSESGRRDVARVAAFLKHAGVSPARVLHSGKARAQQTAAILGEALGAGGAEAVAGLAPGDDVGAFTAMLGAAEDTLVVGHLPFMARLVGLLVCGDAERTLVSYRPGAVVCLQTDAGGEWSVRWMVPPDLLPDPAAH